MPKDTKQPTPPSGPIAPVRTGGVPAAPIAPIKQGGVPAAPIKK